jgi:hypothetical protein
MRSKKLIVLAVTAFVALLFFAAENPATRAATTTANADVTSPAQAQAEKQPPPQDKPAQSPYATQEVIFGKMQPYSHKSELFTVSFPDNWTVKDNSTADEVILIVSDPTQNGIVVLRCYASTESTPAELSAKLKDFVNDRMSKLDAFTMGEPAPQKDGGFHLIFRYTQTVENQDFRMYGEAFIQQRNGYAGTITLLIPQEQYSAKSKSAYEITDSFHVVGKKQN